MEENKQKQKKLSYEELQKAAGDLYQQNQQLVHQMQQMQAALENKDFDYSSFFVSMLFKVMEHPEMYREEFVKWASDQIESALMSFAKVTEPTAEEKANEAK